MELIKKKFILKSGATYCLNILLKSTIKDMGFFDTLDNDSELVGQVKYSDNPAGYNYVNSYNFFNFTVDSDINAPFPYTVTGFSGSRLSELEKFTVSNDPNVKYFGNGSPTVNGLASFEITPEITAFTYYIGGIQYKDVLLAGDTEYTTTFSFTISSFPWVNFDVKRLIKLESKQNLVENPQVGRDVFIVRQQQAVFEPNYRLRTINSLNDVISYAGGDYFTIFNNT